MRERIPQLEVALIPEAHPAYVFVQRPDAVGAAASAFLDRVDTLNPRIRDI
jgi:hypothetical protein